MNNYYHRKNLIINMHWSHVVKCQYISWQESLHGRENKEVWKWSESPWHKILARIQPMQFTLCIYISFLRYKFQNLKTNSKICFSKTNSTLCPLCNNLCWEDSWREKIDRLWLCPFSPNNFNFNSFDEWELYINPNFTNHCRNGSSEQNFEDQNLSNSKFEFLISKNVTIELTSQFLAQGDSKCTQILKN